MMKRAEFIQLSKAMSRALRHEPWEYELELDSEGWVDVNQLIAAMGTVSPNWKDLPVARIEELIAKPGPVRFELADGKIRAGDTRYFPGRLALKQATPPETLYHGIASEMLEQVQQNGLLPAGRQYVHLSVDVKMAIRVGKRKSAAPVIFVVDTQAAMAEGSKFYIGNEKVWLADRIPWS
ncbi:MAG: RNA 2'-phosphotransferase, partial [Phycisphaerales bacterium]|nr:RNA 2'-phosphotransferase [Phycisphaerales bacterium]